MKSQTSDNTQRALVIAQFPFGSSAVDLLFLEYYSAAINHFLHDDFLGLLSDGMLHLLQITPHQVQAVDARFKFVRQFCE